MAADLTADEIRTILGLEPNATCGFVRITYLSKRSIAPGGLTAPFADGRPAGSALYFMVTPDAPCGFTAFATISCITITWEIRSRSSCWARRARASGSS